MHPASVHGVLRPDGTSRPPDEAPLLRALRTTPRAGLLYPQCSARERCLLRRPRRALPPTGPMGHHVCKPAHGRHAGLLARGDHRKVEPGLSRRRRKAVSDPRWTLSNLTARQDGAGNFIGYAPLFGELEASLKKKGIPIELETRHTGIPPGDERRQQFEAVDRWFNNDWKRIEPKLRSQSSRRYPCSCRSLTIAPQSSTSSALRNSVTTPSST